MKRGTGLAWATIIEAYALQQSSAQSAAPTGAVTISDLVIE